MTSHVHRCDRKIMTDVTLNIYVEDNTEQVLVEGSKFTIGSSENASLQLSDESLSPIHASINREDQRVWVLDESGKGTVFVNNQQVSSQGASLNDNDRLTIGGTLIIVRFNQGLTLGQGEDEDEAEATASTATSSGSAQTPSSSWRTFLMVGTGTAVLTLGLVGVGLWATSGNTNNNNQISNINENIEEPTPEIEETPTQTPTPQPTLNTTSTPSPNTSPTPIQTPVTTTSFGKAYLKMSEQERIQYLIERAKLISQKMSNRSYEFTPEVIQHIKKYVDVFASRVGNGSTRMWGEDLNKMFLRAQKFAPHIIKAFKEKDVPVVVGLYLVVVETEYHNIHSENFAGAAGLFQFIGPTAEAYGVPRAERTNIEKMAPAAASYLNDRIAEFGTDPMSVALGIAGYNRSPDSVRRDLQDVISSGNLNKERSFWNLIANSDKLDHYFQGENIKYVPKYFGAAIVGEYPEDFGLDMRPLSTYETITVPAEDLVNER